MTRDWRAANNRVNEKAKVQVNRVIAIEGIMAEAKALPQRRLSSIWKELTRKPFPKVKAFQLKDTDFNQVIRIRKCREDELRELEEWNAILLPEGTDACVLNAEARSSLDYIILVRENPYNSLGKILRHELTHIARNDL